MSQYPRCKCPGLVFQRHLLATRTTFYHAYSCLQQGGILSYYSSTSVEVGHAYHQYRAHVRMFLNELFYPERNRHLLVPKSHLQFGHARRRKARFGIRSRQAGCINACLQTLSCTLREEWNRNDRIRCGWAVTIMAMTSRIPKWFSARRHQVEPK
jgi:hypothetical protein